MGEVARSNRAAPTDTFSSTLVASQLREPLGIEGAEKMATVRGRAGHGDIQPRLPMPPPCSVCGYAIVPPRADEQGVFLDLALRFTAACLPRSS